ncbi:MAG: late competence development ComFB family protein [Candidatus Schekmanbacteria bacterium]|nr:late competence development ComFB family protein [Candidatus Schekmanbacteria bacterium]
MLFFTPDDLAILTNHNKAAVLDAVERFLAGDEATCTCRECRLDIAAITLNRVPPRYLASEEHARSHGRTVADADPDLVRRVVGEAAAIVARRPHHD